MANPRDDLDIALAKPAGFLMNPVDLTALPDKLGQYQAPFAMQFLEPPAPPVNEDPVDPDLAILLALGSAVGLPRHLERERPAEQYVPTLMLLDTAIVGELTFGSGMELREPASLPK